MNKTIAEYLENTALKYPEKVAISDENREMTFSDLRKEARNIAMNLAQRGLFKKPVAIYMDKCVECFAAMVAVTYSGNFYTVLDVHMPMARIEKITQTLQPSVVLTDKVHRDELEEKIENCEIVLYEDIKNTEAEDKILADVYNKIVDTDIMFVLFTSGSTGTPKGVVLPHKAVIPYIEWGSEKFGITSENVFGNQAPFYFILSAFELFQTLKNGSTVRIFSKKTFSFPMLLLGALKEKKVNTLVWVPSALCMIANYKALPEIHLDDLKLVIFGGEVMPCKQLNMWRKEYPEVTFVNQYGPTELTDITTYYFVDREFNDSDTLPIGKPAEHMNVFLIGEDGKEVKRGEVGELFSRGPSVTYGYYGDPERTAEVFVQNPLNDKYPEIVYRTGDLVYFDEEGNLIFVGRKDFQIKHMGNRIELGEIEAVVSAVEGLDRNCCLYDTKKSRIWLFYTGTIEEKTLKEQLKEALPSYMLPNVVKKVEAMPLNLNGKIDRVALKEYIN